ncbi:hypothetical protein BJ138DRAFT_1016167 [Hygrophoropsis aurantiaca]|uniref:Uncharacterized protein n=1 Tax=Hygrophoropsis aurantiaca TaxID=72124 RepID=A0ACB7ZYY8_9AGAM|nr:hypothetical protein BJ138DRAFT_1016167 [Hygrophoropsis aurantiaca]
MDDGPVNNGKWQHLPVAGEPDKRPEDLAAGEGWTTNLKSNLMSAIGAVTGKRAVPAETEGEDKFTSPPQRTSPRRSPDPRWGENFEDRSIKRALSASSAVSRSLYTLHETGDGAGVVHIRGMEDYMKAGDRTWSPGYSKSTLQFGDSRSTLRPGITPVWTRESQAPLLANEAPAARTKPRTLRYDTRRSVASHASAYSTESAAASAKLDNYTKYAQTKESLLPPVPPLHSRTSTLRSTDHPSTKSSSKKRRKRTRPMPIQRVSSSTSSVLSFGSDLMRPGSMNLSIKENAARKALLERRRRMAMNTIASDD